MVRVDNLYTLGRREKIIPNATKEQDQGFSYEPVILQYYLFPKHIKDSEILHSA